MLHKAIFTGPPGTINLFGDKQLISLGVGAENLTRFYVFPSAAEVRWVTAPGSPGGHRGLWCWGSCSHVPPLPGWFCSGSRALCWDKWAFSCPSLSWALTDGLSASRLFYPPRLFLGFSLCILFPASFPFRSRCNRHKQGGRGRCCAAGRRGVLAATVGTFAPWALLFSFGSICLICRCNSSAGQEPLG